MSIAVKQLEWFPVIINSARNSHYLAQVESISISWVRWCQATTEIIREKTGNLKPSCLLKTAVACESCVKEFLLLCRSTNVGKSVSQQPPARRKAVLPYQNHRNVIEDTSHRGVPLKLNRYGPGSETKDIIPNRRCRTFEKPSKWSPGPQCWTATDAICSWNLGQQPYHLLSKVDLQKIEIKQLRKDHIRSILKIK